jgi:hypothetical protein
MCSLPPGCWLDTLSCDTVAGGREALWLLNG